MCNCTASGYLLENLFGNILYGVDCDDVVDDDDNKGEVRKKMLMITKVKTLLKTMARE